MNNVKFMVRAEFTDGSLKERMEQEGLPQVLKYKKAQEGRISRVIYECSESLAMALLQAGADLEFTQWSPAVLEVRKFWGC